MRRALDRDHGQGYHFAKPLTAEALVQYLLSQSRRAAAASFDGVAL